jgi:alpha-galactosidase
METGQLEHLYYGRKIAITDPDSLVEKHAFAPGNTIAYDQEHMSFTLEDMCLEMSGYGKGDIREPFVEVVCADGSSTTDFVFEKAEKLQGKEAFDTLPGSYDDTGKVEQLVITLKDKNHGFTLELHYYVYEECDIISRSAKFINTSQESVSLRRLMSTQVDFVGAGYVVTSFHGGWTKEMNKYDTTVNIGKFVNSSYTGSSSNRCNPFIMVSRPGTTEDGGDCYGFNLIYSGNHYEAVEVNAFDKTRVVTGINPTNFAFNLEPEAVFEAPEAVMTYSPEGHGGMSRHMHDFVREHIVRGTWKYKERPVLLNSWEASYFDISESSLLKLAKEGKDVGVELFVMDDGWFGERKDDLRALGDWTPNEKKLPNGVDGLCKKINDLGLDFGIWIEPEMVNVDSDLYRAHPQWSIEIPGMNHSEGRNQRILDFCNPEVVDYITEQIKKVLGSANIAYVKWDMNRIFSDYYSQYLPKDRQQEVAHRYICGVYQLAKNLTESFPDILFEGCAAGGNRFDLGVLCYFPQVWASDNTDAVCRLAIQNGYSYGYPMSVVSAHVSACPNHQTLRVTPLASRFAVASFGVLGYECNLCDATKEDKEAIKEQIALYKKYRSVWQQGDFYRVAAGNQYQWNVVSKDKKTAIGMIMQREVQPNAMFAKFTAKGLDPEKTYHFFGQQKKYNIKEFGDLVNTAAPFHVKPDSLVHNTLAKFIKMDGENEDYVCSGGAIMYEGVKLHQSFVGTGYSDQVRHFPDYASRLYFMEEKD